MADVTLLGRELELTLKWAKVIESAKHIAHIGGLEVAGFKLKDEYCFVSFSRKVGNDLVANAIAISWLDLEVAITDEVWRSKLRAAAQRLVAEVPSQGFYVEPGTPPEEVDAWLNRGGR